MKRWLLSGLPLASALAVLAMAGVALSAYGTYRHIHNLLDKTLKARIQAVAEQVVNATVHAAGETPAGLWTEAEGRDLQSRLAVIHRTASLERLFVFDRDLRSLVDAHHLINPGKQYTLLDLSVDGVDSALKGEPHIGTHIFEARRLFNATVPLTLDGQIVGGVYAQANPDFDGDLVAFRRNWHIAGGASALVAVVFLFGLIVVYQHIIRVREELSKQSRLGIIGLLSAGISHDIKNPLGSIMAASDLLERHTKNNTEASELIGYIRNGADRILDITQSLLSGADVTDDEPVVIKDLCSSLSKQVIPICLEKGIKIVEDVDGALVAWGSLSALRMAIANVLKNAIEAVPREQGRIQITGRRCDGRVAIVISDNGPGIPPSMQKKIFDTLVTTKETGSGIGLPVTRQIIEDMQGTMELETETGSGSTFIMWVPEARQEKDA